MHDKAYPPIDMICINSVYLWGINLLHYAAGDLKETPNFTVWEYSSAIVVDSSCNINIYLEISMSVTTWS